MSAGDDFVAAVRQSIITALYDQLRRQLELGHRLTLADLVTAVDLALATAMVKDVADTALERDATCVALSAAVGTPDAPTQAELDAWEAARLALLANPYLALLHAP